MASFGDLRALLYRGHTSDVADQDNHRMQKFTTAGTFVTAWGSAGSANGQFMRPAGVAADSGGHVYVVDQDNHRVQKFTNTGTFVTAWGSAGNGNGQFRRPTGIAVDAAGQVYVTDCDNDRIQKFDATGTFLAQWELPGATLASFVARPTLPSIAPEMPM